MSRTRSSCDRGRLVILTVSLPHRECPALARDLANRHLEAVRARLAELRALERSIAGSVASRDASCAGGPGPDCVILEDLSKLPEPPVTATRPRSKMSVAAMAVSYTHLTLPTNREV